MQPSDCQIDYYIYAFLALAQMEMAVFTLKMRHFGLIRAFSGYIFKRYYYTIPPLKGGCSNA